MALKAEPAPPDCIQVTLKCEDVEEVRVEDDGDEGEDGGSRAQAPTGRWPPPRRRRALPPAGPPPEPSIPIPAALREPVLRVGQPENVPLPGQCQPETSAAGSEEAEPLQSWEQEYLVGNSPGGSGRALCMVCGQELPTPSARSARRHILRQHPHTLGLSPGEKSNILEAWSEGVALLDSLESPSPPSTDPPETPAEIVVLLDSEEKPESQLIRNRPRGLRPLQPPPQPFSAPTEVRHFTDGSFPPGFVLQLFSHSQLKASKARAAPLAPKEGEPVAQESPKPPQSPSPAPSAGLRGTLDLQVVRVRLEEPPAVSLLQEWSKAPQGPRTAANESPGWQAVLAESSVAAREQPEAGQGV
ncbi:spindlin interactor and repressor of chromatin-binding protein isoform X4 [Sarcophilus harrisii]|uniref:spindlin interactor and repressor of chromatin-binding protein isoform X4 n=1 Tax=Sarcophilus harrisii TaxID=9305 RepID=UPI001301F764|nr:spindlin interactor and repressor of chromatin-binding protein isoform X4 [Sarcophilus harrisii]